MTRRPGSPRRSLLLILPGLILLLGLLSACQKPEPIVIGGLVSETGQNATYGKAIRQGIDLAVEDVNARGGVLKGHLLEIQYRDDASSPDRAKTLVNELITQAKVKAIIGGVSSSVSLAVLPILREKEIPIISPSSSAPQLSTSGSGWFFRVYPSDVAEAKMIAELARQLDANRVAVLTFNDSFGLGIAELFSNEFERLNGTVVLKEIFEAPIDPKRATEIAKKVKASGAQGVYLACLINEAAVLLQALGTEGFKGVRMATSAVTPEIIRLAGSNSERLVFPQPTFELESSNTRMKDFIDKFKRKYNTAPNLFAAYGFDAARAMIAALHGTRMATPAEIRGKLSELSIEGVGGPIRFDSNGDVKRDPHLYVITKGEPFHFEGLDSGIRGIILEQ